MRLTEDIHRIDGTGGVNAYAILGEDDVTLVDTGFPGKADAILGYLRDLGYEPGDIHTIVLTHGDTDHIGSVRPLKQVTGARVAIHELDAPTLTGAPYTRASGMPGVVFRVLRSVIRSKPLEPDIILRDGDTIAGFRVHLWPGHTPGSIVLERDDGVVFTGDTMLGDAKGAPQMPAKGLAWDFAQATESAERVAALDYTLLLPGHGEPVRRQRG